ncbi:hypothetical protein ACN47E_003076 [Coniothyrium glycines]
MDAGNYNKAAEAEHHTGQSQTDDLPAYEPSADGAPRYEAIQQALTNLQRGDPDETISVPMVHRKDSTSLHRLNPFSRKGYEKTPHYITARKMKRSQYLAHYAKDAEGNYIGTSNPAPDAGLVFVAGKGTSEDLLKQVEEVALGVQERRGNGIGKFGKPL